MVTHCVCDSMISSWIAPISPPSSADGPRPQTFLIRPTDANEFLHPWPLARRAELLAALGERDRYLRAAARLVDFDGATRPDPYEVAMSLWAHPQRSRQPRSPDRHCPPGDWP